MNQVQIPAAKSHGTKWLNTLIWGVVLAVMTLAWNGSEMAPLKLISDAGNMAQLVSDFFPPDFSQWRSYLDEMLITVYIGIWGTFLAIICAVPLGLMCAENIAPKWLCQITRRAMDALRSINEVEGVRATGADKIGEIMYGVLPQVMPLWISYSLYRFESNVRSATVVGMVGAGGIGVLLWENLRGFDFPSTCAIMIIIIATVSIIDTVSQYLRKRFI